jgi:hypothetical protein
VSLDINTNVASAGTPTVKAILKVVDPFFNITAVISAALVPFTLAIIKELILKILFDAAALVTIAVALVVTTKPAVLPKMFDTFTIFGFAILFPY